MKKRRNKTDIQENNNKGNHEENYTQYDPSISSKVQYPLSDYVPKQSHTPRQTCISPNSIYYLLCR